MTKADRQVITELETVLTRQDYSPVVVRNYCTYVRGFLDHLAQRNIPVADVTEAQVEQYLREAVALFQHRYGRSPGPRWHEIPCAAIQALLRHGQSYGTARARSQDQFGRLNQSKNIL